MKKTDDTIKKREGFFIYLIIGLMTGPWAFVLANISNDTAGDSEYQKELHEVQKTAKNIGVGVACILWLCLILYLTN